MTSKAEVAVQKFLAGYNCAQSVLYAFSEDLHLDADMALRLACGFGSGMARKQEVCGALTGGIIAIGLRQGRGQGQDKTLTEDAYHKVRELLARFEAVHGSCRCRDLLQGCDLNTPEGQQTFGRNDLLHNTCQHCVQTVVCTLEELL